MLNSPGPMHPPILEPTQSSLVGLSFFCLSACLFTKEKKNWLGWYWGTWATWNCRALLHCTFTQGLATTYRSRYCYDIFWCQAKENRRTRTLESEACTKTHTHKSLTATQQWRNTRPEAATPSTPTNFTLPAHCTLTLTLCTHARTPISGLRC